MKKILLALAALPAISSAQLVEQDFSSSSTVSDYVSGSPGAGQFNSIGSSGAGVAVSVSSGKLRYVRAGANTGSFTRNTDLAGPPSSLIFQVDLNFSGSTTAATSVCVFYAGSNFSTTNTTEANADVYARFSLNTTTTEGNFVVRDITNGANSITLSGNTRITWVMNNSGSAMAYKGPDGNISVIGNDKADIWGGSILLFEEAAVQTSAQTITDIKFIMNQGSQILDIDNLLADPLPSATLTTPASELASTSFTANWNVQAGISGYRLDVSKNSDFSSFVTGYNGLYISGASTSSAPVTGLQWGSVYYYRVRSSSKYTVGEFESDHSNVNSVITGILPVQFSAVSARRAGSAVQLHFTNATESMLQEYQVQGSVNGADFNICERIRPRYNHEAAASYISTLPVTSSTANYYRVAAIGIDGSVCVSPVVKLSLGPGNIPQVLFTGSSAGFHARTENLPAGRYILRIFNSSGVCLYREMFLSDGRPGILRPNIRNAAPGICYWWLSGTTDLSGKILK